MMYSALFGISRLTTSPFAMPWEASIVAARFTAAENSEQVNLRPSISEKRNNFSGVDDVRASRRALILFRDGAESFINDRKPYLKLLSSLKSEKAKSLT